MPPRKSHPKNLTPKIKQEIIDRRGHKSDKSGAKRNLEIHHMDRNPRNNDPKNLRVLSEKEHDRLHARDR